MSRALLAALCLLAACAGADADGDGHHARDDCDDGDASVYPDAPEYCNGADDDCDGAIDEGEAVDATGWSADVDGDGFGGEPSFTACTAPPGYLDDSSDCNDRDETVYPGAEERCNDADDDCDGVVDEEAVDADPWYADADGDGFGDPTAPTQACEPPEDHVADDTDCDDTEPRVHPGATEWCNEVDDDCDTEIDEDDAIDAPTWHPDGDSDGYGASYWGAESCEAPPGWLADWSDCNDDNPDIHPGADEVYYDGVDSNCDGASDYDADGDGYDSDAYDGEDCDDSDPSRSPDAAEVSDLFDNDCDGACDEGFVAAGDLVITELMIDPAAVNDSAGEWLELANVSGSDVAICGGWELWDDGKDSHEISLDLVLADGDLLLLGREDDTDLNGGVTLDYEYADFQLMNDGDTIYLDHAGTLIDEVSYDPDETVWDTIMVSGYSVQLDPDSLDATSNDDATSWCTASEAMDSGDYGTPGDDNSECAVE